MSIVKEKRAGSLNQWLRDNKYQPVAGGDKVIEWYRKKGYVFACMRVSDAALSKDREKLTQLTDLRLNNNQLTDVKGLEKLTQLRHLYLQNNPDLTKAQIAELKKALPKCRIFSNPKK